MAGALGSPYMHCRFCGTRFTKKEISEHELECLVRSEEQLSENSEPEHDDNNKKSPAKVIPLKDKKKTGNISGKQTNKLSQKDNVSDNQSPSTSQGNNSANKNPPTFTSEEHPLPQRNQVPKQDPSKEKEALKEVAYPKVSAEMMSKAENSDREPLPSQNSLPLNSLVKNEPKQAWNANAPRKMSAKLDDPFPPAKHYRHYPVSCEFCNKKFQPGPLRKHIQKYHPDEHLPPGMRGRDQGRIRPPDPREEEKKKRPTGGPPRRMKICYICGRMFGSKSIHIHEPKCLEKWRLQNEMLPKHKRMPEPVKPEAIPESSKGESLPGSRPNPQRNLPDLDAEAEAAYRCHLKNLVPCSYCGRTFNPDRVMVHESACIERPRKKKKSEREKKKSK